MSNEFNGGSEGTITITPGPPSRIVLIGEFDVANSNDLMEAFAQVPNDDAILDLARVTFCSSALLGCLSRLQQRVVRGGHRIELSGMSPTVRRLLNVTSTVGLFPMITDRA